MKSIHFITLGLGFLGLLVLGFNVGATPHEAAAGFAGLAELDHSGLFTSLIMAGTVGNSEAVMRMLDGVEKSLADFQTQAKRELQEAGRVSVEVKNALDTIGLKQRELADEILLLKQKGVSDGNHSPSNAAGWGAQVIKNTAFADFARGERQKAKFNIQNNTLTGSSTTVGADRRPGAVPGAFAPLNLEALFKHFPTGSDMIEYTRENVFTNSAAETAEGNDGAESSVTFTLVQQPVSTVSHWLKISKQLMADHAALAEYINTRLMWGVQRRADKQIVAGNGVAPNMSGLFASGNYAEHGYTAAQVGTPLPKHRLIRMVIADLQAGGYVPNAVLLNPANWLLFDLDLLASTPAAVSAADIANGFVSKLFGVPVVQSSSVTADTFLVLDSLAAGSVYDRQEVAVEFSDSDDDNFTKGLVTVRAVRRLAMAVEQTGAIRGGDLTPA